MCLTTTDWSCGQFGSCFNHVAYNKSTSAASSFTSIVYPSRRHPVAETVMKLPNITVICHKNVTLTLKKNISSTPDDLIMSPKRNKP